MKRTIAALATALMIATSLQAQQGEGYNESVVVRGSYRPDIEPGEKLNFPAVITDTLGRMEHTFNYSISPVRLKALYEPTRIKAARIVGEPTTKLYNNYLRLGFGNYWSPLADLYWCSTRDRQKTYGVRVNHRSSWDRLPDYGPNHYNNTAITLFGKYIVADKLQLSADAGYEHDHNLYYGFTDSLLQARLSMPRNSVRTAQYRSSYNLATFNVGVKNMQLDPNKLGYEANLHLSDLWATWGQNQFALGLEGDVHYGFNIMHRYRGVAYLHAEWQGYADRVYNGASMPLGYTLSAPVVDTLRGHRNIVKLNPYADFMFNGLHFHAGVTTAWDGFSTDSVGFRLYPDVVVSKHLLHDNLVVSLGAMGGLDANNWNSLRIINPYLAPGSQQRATSHYDFVALARWSISKKLEAAAEVSYRLLRDDATFTLDTLYGLDNVYRPLYTDNNRLTVGGSLTFVNDEMLRLQASGHYYAYQALGDDTAVLYRPNWDALLSATVNYHNRWLFSLEAQLVGTMHADLGQTLPMRYGIAAEVEYRHNRALSFFLRADNLAFQRYFYWANYPSQRGLFMLGLTYTIN